MKRAMRRAAAGRQGSQIAEATLVYPVIIVVSVMSVAAMAHFYSCSANAAAMSIDARSIAGETARSIERNGGIYDAVAWISGGAQDPEAENDNYYGAVYGKDSDIGKSYSLEEESGLLYSKVTASYRARFSMSGMFSASRSDIYAIECSAVNETKLIWKKQLVGEIFGSITDNGAPAAPSTSENASRQGS